MNLAGYPPTNSESTTKLSAVAVAHAKNPKEYGELRKLQIAAMAFAWDVREPGLSDEFRAMIAAIDSSAGVINVAFEKSPPEVRAAFIQLSTHLSALRAKVTQKLL